MATAGITSPTPGTTLTGAAHTFTWAAGTTTGITTWALYGGTTAGSNDLFHKTWFVGTETYNATNIPTDKENFYLRFHWKIGAVWYYTDHIYPINTGAAVVVPPYQEWLLDTREANNRILLVEIDHSAGTMYLASQPWLSETNQAYDDWLTSEPQIEDSLEDFLSVGDIDIVNPDTSLDLLSYNWRGHECRWYYGSMEWEKADFKNIATVVIDGCRKVDGREFRFDLLDNGQALRKTWRTSDHTYTSSARTTMNAIMVEAGEPAITYTNVPESTRSWSIYFEATSDSILADILKSITRSIGAWMRIRQDGSFEVFIPDRTLDPVIVLTDDDIVFGSVNMVDIIHPYKTAVVVMEDGTEKSESTTASTGVIDERHVWNTILDDGTKAQVLVDEHKVYYATAHPIWEMAVIDIADEIQVGDHIGIDHTELVNDGIVSRIKRSPLSAYTLIEVTV
ncbi:MAG: hypothetical protein GY941_19805 [Planctomycetes bacterium]|nr:hypothetical protein [Planctomycetota bacterium]